ncbi:MAG TPA: plastocyanin/azurin family copper-binding protein [Gemmatimonadales bacterium]|nr:plastocyanin/azurin family copper-binding protein [Gemmatimonadales bacterium]
MNRWSLAALPILALGAAAFARPSTHAAPPATHHVTMVQQGAKYLFVPANFTIASGDIVEFENVSGGPHNVAFDKDHIPAGARDVLNGAMARRQGDLMGPFLTTPHEKYTITFTGAPKGTYSYFCLPHRALGMVGVITVQ